MQRRSQKNLEGLTFGGFGIEFDRIFLKF